MSQPPNGLFDVRRHGAAGDGRTSDTRALQEAVDRCHAAGGGVVLCPPGTYLTGSIELRDNVELQLSAGATLKASEDRAQYRGIPLRGAARMHLVFAKNARNIAVTGRGTIDGSGTRFFAARPGAQRMVVRDWRPLHLLAFVECEDLLVRDVHLNDSPCYSLWALGCARVRVQSVTVTSNRWGPNTDGIDIDCCRDVFISDCSVDCGDDAIAIKSDTWRLGREAACENVTVTNCVLRTTCCGVRVGYEGDGPIRDCVFSNLVMRDTRTGIDLLVPRHVGEKFVIEHGPAIENVSFSNLVLDTEIAFRFWVADDAASPGGICGISVSDAVVRTADGCYIGGARANPIRNVRFRNLDLAVAGNRRSPCDASPPDPYPLWGGVLVPHIPHAWFFRHVRGLAMDNVRVDWRAGIGPWRSALRAEHVCELDICNLAEDGQRPGRSPALDLFNVQNASIRSVRAATGSGVFMRVAGAASKDVTSVGCDLSRVHRKSNVEDRKQARLAKKAPTKRARTARNLRQT